MGDETFWEIQWEMRHSERYMRDTFADETFWEIRWKTELIVHWETYWERHLEIHFPIR